MTTTIIETEETPTEPTTELVVIEQPAPAEPDSGMSEMAILAVAIGALTEKVDILLGKTDRVEGQLDEVQTTVEDTQIELTEAIIDAEIENEIVAEETAEEIAEVIEQIDNDIDVEDEMVTETLDTNSVIDAIAPEIKKEKRRVIFL